MISTNLIFQDSRTQEDKTSSQSSALLTSASPDKDQDLHSCTSNNKVSSDLNLWHKRLGHPCTKVLSIALEKANVKKGNVKHLDFYTACKIGKSRNAVFPRSESHAKNPLDIVYADLWGPAPILTSEGYRYYIAFLDDHTRFTWLYPLKTKDEAK